MAPRRGRCVALALAALLVPFAAGGPSGGVCVPIPVEPAECPAYVGAAAECPYRIVPGVTPGTCDSAACIDRCTADADCLLTGTESAAPYCVVGNCVTCWQDVQCRPGAYCRDGRCKDAVADPPGCPEPGACDADRCRLVSVSEEPCPVCVCDSDFDVACDEDTDCQVLSSYPYRRCVYGRCTECRSDEDCPRGTTCQTPGTCFVTEPDPSALYGLWLIGWSGGLDHFSYLRFEPDGALRRGAYPAAGAWSDDVLVLSCADEWPPSAPQLGTWERAATQSIAPFIHIRPNGDCRIAEGNTRARWGVTFRGPGALELVGVDGELWLIGVRVPAERCTPDLATCEPPSWDDLAAYPWE